jgi:hypothetical protein
MDKIDKVANPFVEKIIMFMANKKMWVFWTLYTIVSGVLFGVLYGAFRLVAQRWWIAPIIIIGIGLIWGTSQYSAMKSALQSEKAA